MAIDLNTPEAQATKVLNYFHRGVALLEFVPYGAKHIVLSGLDRLRLKAEGDAEISLVEAMKVCADRVIEPANRGDTSPDVVLDHLEYVLLHLDLLDVEALRLIAEYSATEKSGCDDPDYGRVIQALQTCCEQKIEEEMPVPKKG